MKPSSDSDRYEKSGHYNNKNDRCYMLETQYKTVRTVRECKHCGREFQSLKEDYCSNDCLREIS